MSQIWSNNEAIEIFREYLRIPSVQPDVDYEPCVKFLKNQARKLKLPATVYYASGNLRKPIVVITWQGINPSLPSIVLNSHMDVVPVFEERWTHPPFSAHIDDSGRIYGRGAQDMKCVGVQYICAIQALLKENTKLNRTVHLTFVPDEEIGGQTGMGAFVKSDDFKSLNVGFSLDEGIASQNDSYSVFYAERACWFIYINVNGTPGHGSFLHKNTAGEKISAILDKVFEFRKKEVKKLDDNPNLTIGDVTTINLTKIEGGVQTNVVPPMMKLTFDVRLTVDVAHLEFEEMLRKWCTEAGDGVELHFEMKSNRIEPTKIDGTNLFWTAFKGAMEDDLKLQIKPQIFTGTTDSRYIRATGIPAIGFTPIINTSMLLHDNDEYLGAETFLKGIEVYKKIIGRVANV